MIYYTEYPVGEFLAASDEEALNKTKAKVVYRETQESKDGTPFVFIREEKLNS